MKSQSHSCEFESGILNGRCNDKLILTELQVGSYEEWPMACNSESLKYK